MAPKAPNNSSGERRCDSQLKESHAAPGAVTIPESVSHPSIEQAARSVLRNEYLPTVAVPRDVDVDAYEEELFTRWRNTALGHRTSQVGSDGSVKLRQRRLVAGDERRDDLRVEPRLEPHAVGDELGAQLLDIDEVPVVA